MRNNWCNNWFNFPYLMEKYIVNTKVSLIKMLLINNAKADLNNLSRNITISTFFRAQFQWQPWYSIIHFQSYDFKIYDKNVLPVRPLMIQRIPKNDTENNLHVFKQQEDNGIGFLIQPKWVAKLGALDEQTTLARRSKELSLLNW